MCSPDAKHVMISYQWDVQKLVIQIKNKLQADGFKVWMDIDEMGGSTLESMAKAVENASVVLVCVSQKYKESPNCRSGNDENCFATFAGSFHIASLIIEILAFYRLFRIVVSLYLQNNSCNNYNIIGRKSCVHYSKVIKKGYSEVE